MHRSRSATTGGKGGFAADLTATRCTEEARNAAHAPLPTATILRGDLAVNYLVGDAPPALSRSKHRPKRHGPAIGPARRTRRRTTTPSPSVYRATFDTASPF